eukprot:9469289-Pyramimonas_sp.AAC.2
MGGRQSTPGLGYEDQQVLDTAVTIGQSSKEYPLVRALPLAGPRSNIPLTENRHGSRLGE